MTDEAVIQGTYADLKLIKTRKMLQIVVELPIERLPEVVRLFGAPDYAGEIPVAVARLEIGGPPTMIVPDDIQFGDLKAGGINFVKDSQPAAPKPKSYAQEAGIYCNNVTFQAYLGVDQEDNPADAAAEVVRGHCRVDSRRDLIAGTPAGHLWRDLMADYEAWKFGLEPYEGTSGLKERLKESLDVQEGPRMDRQD